ncbi:MAG: DNA alkylation repair protein [Kiritimatiellae bacterium]|nr:DNA alkylation repair protein [Kiritimatiellia bacterium]MDD4737379.1 DNA alkylation repair protein [Kiritimatiellia bacterium]
MDFSEVKTELRRLAKPDDAVFLQRFFKTGPGEYGEGDRFIGIRVPILRDVARQALDLPLVKVKKFLRSRIHEERLLALLILVLRYKRKNTTESERTRLYRLYLDHTAYINNWDLVDLSAHCIVGPYLDEKPRDILYTLAKSSLLWDRRIAIIATFYFIRKNDFTDTLQLAEILRDDPHDLIHKAVGWMLREVGKRDLPAEESFLKKHYHRMPRTMLRYAIEKFPEPLRQAYLSGSALDISKTRKR